MSDYQSSDLQFEVAPSTTEATSAGTLVLGDCSDLHIGDYVGFQCIDPSKDWKLSLGRVTSFPSLCTVKVSVYDAVNDTAVTRDPLSEVELREKAGAANKMEVWHNREALREDLILEQTKEQAATQRLFAAREKTAARQITIGDRVTKSLEKLDKARIDLQEIPPKEWRDLRSPCLPPDEVIGMLRSVMLIIYEDGVTVWEEIQEVLRRSDFMDRVMSWDCTVTPMSLTRRRRIVALCAGEDVGGLYLKKRRRSGSRGVAPTGPLVVSAKSSNPSNVAVLDECMRAWINAQLACSEAAREQEVMINKCFAEQQEQRVLLREINDMRVGIASMEMQMLEMKSTILGVDNTPKPIMPLEAYPTDTVFYRRTYPGLAGRLVEDVILRNAIIFNFGAITSEDQEGYIRLNATQADFLRSAVIAANVRHDADEMEELLARKEREEQEMADLKARIEELRSRPSLTAEEEEELAQLQRLYADAERRHLVTLSRIADLYACGRGAREITLAIKRPEFCYTRLHCKMSGDWDVILQDPARYSEMLAAFCEDVSGLLNIPASYVLDIDASSGSLLIDFTVKHSGDLDDEELQNLINKGPFSALCMFYEKVTLKKTSPLNTSQQQEMYDLEQRHAMLLPISGMGIKQTLADYYNADGSLDDEFSDDVRASPYYCRPSITIQILREDYDDVMVRGPFEQHARGAGKGPNMDMEASTMAPIEGAYESKEEDGSAGVTQATSGLTETGDGAHDMESEPPTEVRGRTTTLGDEVPPAEAAVTVSAPIEEEDKAAADGNTDSREDAATVGKGADAARPGGKASSSTTSSTSSSASKKKSPKASSSKRSSKGSSTNRKP
ncbi:hypothetical protein LSCM1_04209 [Leishmania martiniquensis]|uniref:Flagellar attachment zone protein 1 conserved domain-containing protein n=1 Tax=Leishmania martiniquensis TaxID=1580590 RepID=A0A836KKP1_9TRYP|nr:hypothetical protein LSCM1_04209 [Leishmania martiniquensis]